MAEAAVKAIFDADKRNRGEQSIEIKEFFWDQFVKYLSSAILALVLLEISVDFFRGGAGVSCFHPADTFSVLHPNLMSPEEVYGFARDQAAFLNSYCASSTPVTEYFPLYIIIHALLIIAPHYIWTAVHKGNFDSFFSIAEKLERLRESNTGEYSKENFDRVSKLEKEYGGRRSIFLTYIAKLILQLCVCIASVGFSGGYLTDFSFAFDCPRSLASDDVIPAGWPLNGTVSCVYVSLRILRLIRVGDFVLTALAGILIIYGLLWCIVRHTEELGYVQVAKFVFQSYLKAEDFQFQSIIRFGKQKPLRTLQSELEVKSSFKYLVWLCAPKLAFNINSVFSPGVRNDLDFLLLNLFRSDTSYGMVFKNVQVTAELQRLSGRDHRLLTLYIMIQEQRKSPPDRDESIEKQNPTTEMEEENIQTCWSYLWSKLKRNDRQSRDQAVDLEGNNSDSESPATPRVSRWIRARAVLLYSICCCFFKQYIRKQGEPKENSDEDQNHFDGDYRDQVMSKINPEKLIHDNFSRDLGNIQLLHQGNDAGMRQMIYLLVKIFGRPSQSKPILNNRALDISFGRFGYFLVLARAFKHVCSVNFHPYYRNLGEVVHEVDFCTNYKLITYPDNIYASKQGNITMANVMLNRFATPPKQLDMILVGPIEDEHHKVSVNIMLNTVKRKIGSEALLLAVRPVRIGSKKCFFHKFEPPQRFFDKYDIRREERISKLIYTVRDEELCFKIKCAGVSCIFEFQAYHYIGDKDLESHETRQETQDSPLNTGVGNGNTELSSHCLRNGGDKNATSRESIQTDSCPCLSSGDNSQQ